MTVRRLSFCCLIASLFSAANLVLPAPSRGSAGDDLRTTLSTSGLSPRREVTVVLDGRDSMSGRLVRYEGREDFLLLKRFVRAESRFRVDPIPLDRVAERRVVHRRPGLRWPLLGSVIGAGAGVAAGWIIGEDRPGGDNAFRDSRPVVALIGGGLGALTGLFAGAIAAPKERTEEVVWSRD